jgi:predicted ATPase
MPEFGDLLERERELEELTTALKEACSAGTGRLIFVVGAAGAGKSRLLATAREQATATDMTVFAARGLELERDVPFGLALRLLERAVTAGAAVPGAGLDDAAIGDGVDRANAMVHGLRELVVRLTLPVTDGRPRPLLTAVDDAEWADPPSLRVLLRLAADVEALPLVMILAVRDGAADRAGFLDRLAERALVLRPAPLSDGAVAELVRAAYPHAAAQFIAACARASGGNPFFLHELLLAAKDGRLPATAEGAALVGRLLPGPVLRSVLLRVARIPDGGPSSPAR